MGAGDGRRPEQSRPARLDCRAPDARGEIEHVITFADHFVPVADALGS
jgi:hypothetical protein